MVFVQAVFIDREVKQCSDCAVPVVSISVLYLLNGREVYNCSDSGSAVGSF